MVLLNTREICLVATAASPCTASAPSPLATTGGSSTTPTAISSPGGLSLSSLCLSGGLRVHVDWLAVFRRRLRFMPTWDIMERTFAGGVILARAHPTGVGSHGVGRSIESVGSVAEELEPSRVDVAN